MSEMERISVDGGLGLRSVGTRFGRTMLKAQIHHLPLAGRSLGMDLLIIRCRSPSALHKLHSRSRRNRGSRHHGTSRNRSSSKVMTKRAMVKAKAMVKTKVARKAGAISNS